MEEKFIVNGRRKGNIKELMPLLSEIGFNKVDYKKSKDRNKGLLYVEKLGEADLHDKKIMDYSISFEGDRIVFTYFVPAAKNKRRRLIEVLPIFLNVLILSEKFYDVKSSVLYPPILNLLTEMRDAMDKDAVDLSTELDELKSKHKTTSRKYEELVRSSEENTRILLECERRRDELRKRVEHLESMGDELLLEEIYNWIKVHNGVMDVSDFSKSFHVPTGRIEEGLDKLIRGGYIKKRG